MKYYIVHGVPSRRERLETHLRERGVHDYFEDVIWVTDFPHDDPFVHWIQYTVARNVSKKALSGFIKFCTVLRMFLADETNEYAVSSDDDVVFIKEWKERLEDADTDKFFTCLALGVNFHMLPDGKTKFTGNIGGCECIMISKKFAKFFLDNIDFRQATDIVISGMLLHHKLPLEITPICQQTSFLENNTSTIEHGETKYETDWITFVTTYTPSGLSYFELLSEYEKFKQKKATVEQDFKDKFGINIDIWEVRYIYERFKALEGKT